MYHQRNAVPNANSLEGSGPTVKRRSSWCLVLAAILILAFGRTGTAAQPPSSASDKIPNVTDLLKQMEERAAARVQFEARSQDGNGPSVKMNRPGAEKKATPKPPKPITRVEQLDGITSIPDELLIAESEPDFGGEAIATTNTRVVSAHAEAWLSNFDADAQFDGWKARLALFDKNDQLVTARGHVTITLAPNLIGSDGHAYRVSDLPIQRWSKKLKFDSNGLMTVRLPASAGLKPILDGRRRVGRDRFIVPGGSSFVPTASRPFVDASSRDMYGRTAASRYWRDQADWSYRNRHRNPDRKDVYRDDRSRDLIFPPYGHLTIRVSVPEQGVFSAETDVRTRPSVKVFQRDHLQP